MPLTVTADLIELTKIGLSKIYLNEFDQEASVYGKLFNVENSQLPLEQELIMAGFGNVPSWNSDGAKLASVAPISGDRITFSHTDYGMQWALSHKLLRDDLYKKTGKDLITSAGISTANTVEATAANIFNLGFSGGATGWDAAQLFSTSHLLLNGDTVANKPSSAAALTTSSLQSAMTAMMRMKNHRGQPVNLSATYLLIPPELYYTAVEIIGNAQAPYAKLYADASGSTAGRVGQTTENVMKGVLTVLPWRYLTATDDWFLVAAPGKNKLKFFWREKPAYDAWRDFETKGVANSVNFAFSVGFTSYEGLYGVEGS